MPQYWGMLERGARHRYHHAARRYLYSRVPILCCENCSSTRTTRS